MPELQHPIARFDFGREQIEIESVWTNPVGRQKKPYPGSVVGVDRARIEAVVAVAEIETELKTGNAEVELVEPERQRAAFGRQTAVGHFVGHHFVGKKTQIVIGHFVVGFSHDRPCPVVEMGQIAIGHFVVVERTQIVIGHFVVVEVEQKKVGGPCLVVEQRVRIVIGHAVDGLETEIGFAFGYRRIVAKNRKIVELAEPDPVDQVVIEIGVEKIDHFVPVVEAATTQLESERHQTAALDQVEKRIS